MLKFGRLLTAMATPFNADLSVDYARAAELAKRLAASGSDGLVVCGTTGESPTLSSTEKLKLFEAVVEAVGKHCVVIAGTGNNNTADSIALTKKAEVTGVHGIMLVTPYYNKPPQEGLFQHFRSIADNTRLPVMLYNVPSRTGCNMAAETTLRLAQLANVIAVKEASGDLVQIARIIQQAPAGFHVYSGDDISTLPIMSLGGVGVVSVASHVAGPQIAELIKAHSEGKTEQAAALHRRLEPLFTGLFVTTNPILTKESLALAGFPVGGLRPPLVAPTEREREALRAVMQTVGIL